MSGATVTREARTLTGVTECGIGETDLQPVAAKRAGLTGTPPSRWWRWSGSPHREDWADLRPVAVKMPPHAGTPTVQMAPLARERRPLVGTAARSAAKGVYHAAVRMTLNAGVPAERRTTPELGSFPPPAFGGLCRPPPGELARGRPSSPGGAPVPARRSAWWHGRHTRHVQRPRGAFCDSASAPEYEKCGLAPTSPGLPVRYRAQMGLGESFDTPANRREGDDDRKDERAGGGQRGFGIGARIDAIRESLRPRRTCRPRSVLTRSTGWPNAGRIW